MSSSGGLASDGVLPWSGREQNRLSISISRADAAPPRLGARRDGQPFGLERGQQTSRTGKQAERKCDEARFVALRRQHVQGTGEQEIAHLVGLKELRRRHHAVRGHISRDALDLVRLALAIKLFEMTADRTYLVAQIEQISDGLLADLVIQRNEIRRLPGA